MHSCHVPTWAMIAIFLRSNLSSAMHNCVFFIDEVPRLAIFTKLRGLFRKALQQLPNATTISIILENILDESMLPNIWI